MLPPQARVFVTPSVVTRSASFFPNGMRTVIQTSGCLDRHPPALTEDLIRALCRQLSAKNVRDALVREALKDEAFRESLLANPKFAVERALGTTLPDRLEVVLLRETQDLMYIVLPKEFPSNVANLSDAELETVAEGLLDTNVPGGGQV